MHFQKLKSFLQDKDIHPCGKALPFDYYTEVITECKRLYGNEVGQWLMDCFSPQGEAVQPGYEDCFYYSFDVETWDELEHEFRQWAKHRPPKYVLDLEGCMHIAVAYNKHTLEAKFSCIENSNPKSIFNGLYPWRRAFVPSPNCTIQEKERCSICFPTEPSNL